MPTPAESTWTTEPFRMGTAEEFARLRELLVRSGFTEPEVCQLARVQSIHQFPSIEEGRTVFGDAADARSLFVRLFLDCASVPWTTVRGILSSADLDALESLGLLLTASVDGVQCDATVAIYPLSGVYVASDRHADLHMSGSNPPPDLVYSPMTKETARVLTLMPRLPCEDYLEVCSGSGVAALIAGAHFATRAVAVDVTERSTRFARFNALLNGLTNVTALQGDVYAPVAGRTFDLIVAHPPYMPSFETEYVYRDGGEDGEQISRRAIAGITDSLRPGGQFYCDCAMSDRAGAPVEQRIRDMLGDRGPEFDVVVAEARSFDPVTYYADQARQGKITFASIERRHEAFSRLGIRRFVSVSMLLRRTTASRPVVTTRRQLSPLTGWRDFQWLLGWASATAAWTPDETRRLIESRPIANPRVELRSRSTLREGQWLIEQCDLVTATPFGVEASGPAWFATLLMWCDGRATARELLARLREMGVVPPHGAEDAFAGIIRQLIDSGLVEIAEFRRGAEQAMSTPAESGNRLAKVP